MAWVNSVSGEIFSLNLCEIFPKKLPLFVFESLFGSRYSRMDQVKLVEDSL